MLTLSKTILDSKTKLDEQTQMGRLAPLQAVRIAQYAVSDDGSEMDVPSPLQRAAQLTIVGEVVMW